MTLPQPLWRFYMRLRFPRPPKCLRASDGRFTSRRHWRAEQMRGGQ